MSSSNYPTTLQAPPSPTLSTKQTKAPPSPPLLIVYSHKSPPPLATILALHTHPIAAIKPSANAAAMLKPWKLNTRVLLMRKVEKPPAVEIYDLVDTLHSCKQAPGKSVSAHVLEMKGYMDQLQALGKPYDNDMAINLINRSLNKDFGDFVRNFNMHCVGKTVSELHALLIDYEKGLKDKAPTPQLVTGRGTALFTSKSCAQIRTTRLSTVLQLQGFRVKRKLSYGEQYLHVGNGAQAAVEAIGVFNLVLPSGLVLAISVNGVFEIDMNDNVSKYNNNSIFSINKKRKLDLNSSYLWHWKTCPYWQDSHAKASTYLKSEVELKLGKKIKALRSDRGGEYLSQEFKEYLGKNGIVQHLTSPYTPQQMVYGKDKS
ncbi:retrotransposon protein, putative, ty1-copia subclass [Tanacetum coccineum]